MENKTETKIDNNKSHVIKNLTSFGLARPIVGSTIVEKDEIKLFVTNLFLETTNCRLN
jgi:RNA-binding protein YlmH